MSDIKIIALGGVRETAKTSILLKLTTLSLSWMLV